MPYECLFVESPLCQEIGVARRVIPYLTAEISKALKIAEEKISILDLEDAAPSLRLRVLRHGVRLLDRGGYEEVLKKGLEHEVVEVMECERASFYAWLDRDGVDEALIMRILTKLREDVEDLRELREKGFEGVMWDKYLRKALERTIQTAIEGMIDLLRHIVSSLGLGVAEYYKDYVEICRDRGVISGEVVDKLLELMPMRHALVHRYREINYEKLWIQAEMIIDVASRLEKEVRDYLARRVERASYGEG
ncbi:MAG: DUF86 domain-containing protein [Sulfolobales archaeon]